MNNRKRKRLKVTKKSYVDERIHQIFDLCLKINSLEARTQKHTGELPTVFFRFSGHVASAEVYLYPNGYSSSASSEEEYLLYQFYLSGNLYERSEVEECYNKLKETYELLEKQNV